MTNSGFPDKAFEREWMHALYIHGKKQSALLRHDVFEYSPRFSQLVNSGGLERKKQQAVYVGFDRARGKIDTAKKMSTPNRITATNARQIISLVNRNCLDICNAIKAEGGYFCVPRMDGVLNRKVQRRLLTWPYRTGLRSRRWERVWTKQILGWQAAITLPLKRAR